MIRFRREEKIVFYRNHITLNGARLDIGWYQYLNDKSCQDRLEKELSQRKKKQEKKQKIKERNIHLHFDQTLCEKTLKPYFKWTYPYYRLDPKIQKKLSLLFPNAKMSYGPRTLGYKTMNALPFFPLYIVIILSIMSFGFYFSAMQSISEHEGDVTRLEKELKDSQKLWDIQEEKNNILIEKQNQHLFAPLKLLSRYKISFHSLELSYKKISLIGLSRLSQWGDIKEPLLNSLKEHGFIGSLEDIEETDYFLKWKGRFTRVKS